MAKQLTQTEIETYRDRGYLSGYSIFDEEGVARLRRGFELLCRELGPGQGPHDICDWEKRSPFLFEIATQPLLLDYVEDLIGPNVLLWSTHFFCKEPGDGSVVAWHQDARYWPLRPHRALTVWLAFDDSDRENGALKVVPATQRLGLLDHTPTSKPHARLGLELDASTIDFDTAAYVELKAGEISLHDDNLVHGSDANTSSRRRCGLTLRYMPPEVKCDRSAWPQFSCRVVRGRDAFNHNRTWGPP